MPKIYLSPSTQESNPYITGSGSEEYIMNRLADALEPYLYANGIRFVRNTPDMTAASSIAQANRLGGFDVYLALHSNAAAPESSGSVRGVLVFYYPTSAEGKRAADLFAANLKRVYPLPDLVRTVPTTALGEVRQPKYPANLLELGYHDNYADAAWVENNICLLYTSKLEIISNEMIFLLQNAGELHIIAPLRENKEGIPCLS